MGAGSSGLHVVPALVSKSKAMAHMSVAPPGSPQVARISWRNRRAVDELRYPKKDVSWREDPDLLSPPAIMAFRCKGLRSDSPRPVPVIRRPAYL